MKKRLFSVFLLSVFMGVALQAGNYKNFRQTVFRLKLPAHSYKAFGF